MDKHNFIPTVTKKLKRQIIDRINQSDIPTLVRIAKIFALKPHKVLVDIYNSSKKDST